MKYLIGAILGVLTGSVVAAAIALLIGAAIIIAWML